MGKGADFGTCSRLNGEVFFKALPSRESVFIQFVYIHRAALPSRGDKTKEWVFPKDVPALFGQVFQGHKKQVCPKHYFWIKPAFYT